MIPDDATRCGHCRERQYGVAPLPDVPPFVAVLRANKRRVVLTTAALVALVLYTLYLRWPSP